MIRKIEYILMIGAVLLCFDAQSQTYLTLDSCRTMALTHNNQAKIAQTQLDKMRYEVNAYRANFFPRVSLRGMYLFTTGSFDYNKHFDLTNTSLPNMISQLPLPDWAFGYINGYLNTLYKQVSIDLDLNLKLNNTFLAGIQFEQPVFMGGKIATAYRMSKIGRQLAQLNRSRSEAEILLKTDQAYWQYAKVMELYATAIKYKEAVENLLIDAQNGVETGLLSENDRMKVQVKLGDATLMVKKAENGKRLAQMNLSMIIGLNLFSPLVLLDTLQDDIPLLLLDEIPNVTVRTEYALLQKQVELKKQQINLTRSDFLPQIALAGGYYYLNGLWLNDNKLLNQFSFSALISLSIPITQWGEGAYRIRSAKADWQIATYQMLETTDLLQLEITQAYNTLDEAALKMEIARTEYQQTQENLRIISDRYELGMLTLSALLEAQTLWQQAGANYTEAKANLHIAKTDYLRTIGSLKNTIPY
jgi:outer membrane protein TolC